MRTAECVVRCAKQYLECSRIRFFEEKCLLGRSFPLKALKF